MAKGNRGGLKAAPKQTPQPKQPTSNTLTLGSEKIEYEGDLTYGNDDATLSANVRKTAEAWEKKRASAKIEYGYAVDTNGNPIGKEVRGGKGSVSTPVYYHKQGATFTHIHPRKAGGLGGTFSPQDISTFGLTGEQTCRAVAKEGTYSISKGQNFHGKSLYKYFKSAEQTADSKRKQAVKPIETKMKSVEKDFIAGKVNYQQYNAAYKQYAKEATKAFNTMLVDLHNALLNGQKQFNYTYTLERRK